MSTAGRRRRLPAIGSVLLALAACAAVVPGSLAHAGVPQPAVARDSAHYAVDRPMCAPPRTAAAMRCFAVKRVPVAATTPGAYRYRSAGPDRGPAGGYTPADLASAYGYHPLVNRSRLTVAVVMWHDNPRALHDLDVFDRHYGFGQETARSFRKVNQYGQPGPLPQADRQAGSEISLDLQAVRAVCRTCRLLLVEAAHPTAASLATAENTAVRLGAQVVSNSFGEPERPVSRRVRQAFDHPGRVLVASVGDDGWYGWDRANSRHGRSDSRASFPASYPGLVGVGATTLRLDAAGSRTSETVWNGNGPADATGHRRRRSLGATGGGCSRLYPAKPWQRNTPGYRRVGCAGKRLSTDLALLGDPQTGFDVFDRYGSSGWVTVGGSSLSAPLAAGMFALAGGSRGVPYASAQLYANSAAHPGLRFDVTSGGNGYCGGTSTARCAHAVRRHQPRAGTDNPNALGRGLLDCSFPPSGDVAAPPRSSECNAVKGFDGPSGIGAPTSIALFAPTGPHRHRAAARRS
ncbi:MAG TPA: S8 family serine peptidase [Jatrophihabitans sp.]|nr:S8 family serine peptidase [Jatrophihabitans sp.]